MTRYSQDIAVRGMGGCSAAGRTIPEILSSLDHGTVNCLPVPDDLFQASLTCPVFAYDHLLPSPDSRKLLEQSTINKEPEKLNRTLLLTLEALTEALEDAGLSPDDLQSRRVGIALGTTVGCTFHDEKYFVSWRTGHNPEPDPVMQYLDSNLALFVQALLGSKGPVAVITNACASGTDAIGTAYNWLRDGACDIAIAGGADALSRIAYYGFDSLMLLSDSPCTPFDKNRSGLNLGEGAGLLFLERQDDLGRTNVRPRGWIRGYGAASDCYHPTSPHPEGRGLQQALQLAMREAGIGPDGVSYINAHGTGTSANDSAEMNALAMTGLTDCPVVSTKGITGHMLGAAGAMEAILTICSLAEKQARGTVNCRTPDPRLGRLPLTESEMVQLASRTGISQSLAFGGTNSALVLEANSP